MSVQVGERNFAFQNRLSSFSIVNRGFHQPQHFFENAYQSFESHVSASVQQYYLIKIVSCLVANFEKLVITEEGEHVETKKMYLHTQAVIVDFETDLRSFYDEEVVAALNHKIDDTGMQGSGFSLSEILELNIQISSFDPCSGSSYIPLPKFLQSKKAIINVKNTDNQCFKYAILSALFPENKNAERVAKYKEHEKNAISPACIILLISNK